MTSPPQLPLRQQLVASGKWPTVGERSAQSIRGTWRVAVRGEVKQPLDLPLDRLQTFPAVERTIDIHCVTRWSKLGVRFRGVLLSEVLAAAAPTATARYVSFIAQSERGHSTSLPLVDALKLGTLVAWQCDGHSLAPEHGGPLRVIVPERYFYKSLKWLRAIELLAVDSLGYWEREAGYHNTGDPWLEQRYMAPNLDRHAAQAALASRNFAGVDLRSLNARSYDLSGLNARGALLRDADLRDCRLDRADFEAANLSNANLCGAALTGARFTNADVEGADFSGADLRGADFTGASLLGTSFFAGDSTSGHFAATIDATSVIPPAQLEMLLPVQAEFIKQALAGST